MVDYLILYLIFLIGVCIATFQDLARREIDNWLNLLLIVIGFSFFLFESLRMNDLSILLQVLFLFVLGLVFCNLFYYGHIFAGGDAKLLLGLSVFFVGSSFLMSFLQFGTFVLFLFFAGGIYGLIYSLVLFLREYTLCSKKFIVYFRKYHGLYFSLLGFGLLLLSSWISFFLLFGVMCILIPILFSFAHALEESVMKRKIKGVEVRLGDWLVNDVKVGKKKVIACFEGVTEEDLKLLKKVDSVEVKDGLPFAPAFLIGFVLYYFYGNSLLQFLMRLFSLLF